MEIENPYCFSEIARLSRQYRKTGSSVPVVEKTDTPFSFLERDPHVSTPNPPPLSRCLISAIAPSRQPECEITYFDASDGGGYVVGCRGLICGVGQEADGTWRLHFTIWVTTVYPWGLEVTKRKVPSAELREQLARIVGIETRLDGQCPYPSLVGKARRQPDPNELLKRMKMRYDQQRSEAALHRTQ